MMSKGVKDEQVRRINSVLEKLRILDFVPSLETIQDIEKQLHKIGKSF